ncbi:ATP-binding protein, partial [Rothia sp. AR01]
DDAPGRIAVGPDAALELHGAGLPASEQRLLPVVATQLAAALEHRRLVETAREAETIAASDRVRGALLSALSHDLRRPLAAAATAVGGLRAAGDALSPADQRELLDTAEESLGSLGTLLTDLLDVSRLQADALTIASTPLDPADALLPALEELGLAPDDVVLSLEHGSAQVLADPILLQRAAVNVLANALRYAPPGTPVRIATSAFEGRVEIRVVDHGPGIPPERRDDVFRPFQRLGDTDNSTGLGLGLALSRGFAEAMRGTLEPEDTPGGGLTMVLSLPAEPDPADVAAVTETAERATEETAEQMAERATERTEKETPVRTTKETPQQTTERREP